MSHKLVHPEQDPAEGSREVIDRELARERLARMRERAEHEPDTGRSDRQAKEEIAHREQIRHRM